MLEGFLSFYMPKTLGHQNALIKPIKARSMHPKMEVRSTDITTQDTNVQGNIVGFYLNVVKNEGVRLQQLSGCCWMEGARELHILIIILRWKWPVEICFIFKTSSLTPSIPPFNISDSWNAKPCRFCFLSFWISH